MITFKEYVKNEGVISWLKNKSEELDIPPFYYPEDAYKYAWKLGRRVPQLEKLIASDPKVALNYTYYIVHNRFKECEPEMKKHPKLWNWYLDYIFSLLDPQGPQVVYQQQSDTPTMNPADNNIQTVTPYNPNASSDQYTPSVQVA